MGSGRNFEHQALWFRPLVFFAEGRGGPGTLRNVSEKNQYLDWQPTDGMRVEVRALVTLYHARGDFQLSVETIRRAGLGTLFEAFEQLKVRLGKEGLFDAERKKLLPSFPKQIGIITSPAAAALHDVLSTLRRRMPSVPVVDIPSTGSRCGCFGQNSGGYSKGCKPGRVRRAHPMPRGRQYRRSMGV